MKNLILIASICFLKGTTGFTASSLIEFILRKAVTSELFASINNVEQPKKIASVANSTQKKKKLKTYSRYLEIESWKRGPAARDLEPVLRSVGEACKQINRIVQRAQTDDLYGVAVDAQGNPLEDTNIQGEVQQKLDLVCNAIMLKMFCGSSKGVIAAVASEEEDEPRTCPDVMGDNAFAMGDYVAVFDPIDGSKNIDSSLPVGTIFGIYKCPPGTKTTEKNFPSKRKRNGCRWILFVLCHHCSRLDHGFGC